MKFKVPQSLVEFDIPDEWWSFAEMQTFEDHGGGYYPYSPVAADRVQVVSLSSVEPPTRSEGVPSFKKYKLVPVLFAFQSPECELPPIAVQRISSPSQYEFRVLNGYHRFYSSVAVGYSKLPIIAAKGATLSIQD